LRLGVAVVALFVTGCSTVPGAPPPIITDNLQPEATWEKFTFCGGFGCTDPQAVTFSTEEATAISKRFNSVADNPQAERQAVRSAIAEMESIAGARTGYDGDRGRTFSGMLRAGQLDCYSEAINTSNFLAILVNAGLIHHHTLAGPVLRGLSAHTSLNFTHATATIRDNETGERLVVDSWFHDNGEPPEILPVTLWLQDWNPEDGPPT